MLLSLGSWQLYRLNWKLNLLSDVMYEKRASDPQLTVSLKADQAARMEIISGIHNELRKADALKLNYSTKVKAPN